MRKNWKITQIVLLLGLAISVNGLFVQCKSNREITIWSGPRFLREANLNTGGGAPPHRPSRPVHKRKP